MEDWSHDSYSHPEASEALEEVGGAGRSVYSAGTAVEGGGNKWAVEVSGGQEAGRVCCTKVGREVVLEAVKDKRILEEPL